MTTVSDLGERKVIEKIIKNLEISPRMSLPFGDDVSVISIDQGGLSVLKTDMLVGETDIPSGMTLRQAARKAIVMTVSDFAAKSVYPLALLVALGLPRETTLKDINDIGKGLNDGVREYNTYLIGGDTGESLGLIICCMGFGTTSMKRIIPRSGARPGDIVAITGPFGRSAAGLKILLEGFKTLEEEKNLLDAVYLPKARLSEGLALGSTGEVSASIDSSDGLAISLYELCKMSQVGFTLTEVPVAEDVVRFAARNNLDPIELGLYGGEEYELVLTVNPDGFDKAYQAVRQVGGELIAIGRATKDQEIILYKNNVEKKILFEGWEHFKR